jgi:hypothetical protein
MNARVIAYYLPQFHPIPENDKVWGKGFTEWTNVAKARPLFHGHLQPRIPADLGFYDLRLPEIREQQAQMAKEAGIEGFCYWHYWMGNGKQLLQRPFEEVLASGKPDFPFCLAWANHDWTTKTWNKKNYDKGQPEYITKQEYPGDEDFNNHFNYVLCAFKDKRYITIDGKPVFLIFDPYHFKEITHFINLWKKMAQENGLAGIHFVAICNSTSTIRRNEDGSITHVIPNIHNSNDVYKQMLALGFDAVNSFGKSRGEMIYMGKYRKLVRHMMNKYLSIMPPIRIDYPKAVKGFFAPEDCEENIYPTIMPQWDRSPRANNADGVYINATPTAFKQHVKQALDVIKNKEDEHKIIFLRSWNEWGEGNYVEPDTIYGHGFLNALKQALWEE